MVLAIRIVSHFFIKVDKFLQKTFIRNGEITNKLGSGKVHIKQKLQPWLWPAYACSSCLRKQKIARLRLSYDSHCVTATTPVVSTTDTNAVTTTITATVTTTVTITTTVSTNFTATNCAMLCYESYFWGHQ